MLMAIFQCNSVVLREYDKLRSKELGSGVFQTISRFITSHHHLENNEYSFSSIGLTTAAAPTQCSATAWRRGRGRCGPAGSWGRGRSSAWPGWTPSAGRRTGRRCCRWIHPQHPQLIPSSFMFRGNTISRALGA